MYCNLSFFQADVFSYGLTMYVMLTKHHPFDELEGKGEMDRAIAEVCCFPVNNHYIYISEYAKLLRQESMCKQKSPTLEKL